MKLLPPIALMGENLGQRHQHLNSLVRDAEESSISFQEVEALPEDSPVDRLFKIDLAIKRKHVDYILRNLKDDDMLYVSRALKATWLLDHHDIVNPQYLEDVLFPEMITPAVTKMKHWLYINLRDPATCQEFYRYHKNNTFKLAIKFLSHCNQEFILAEAPKILTKLSTHPLKVLCEKCPTVAKIYFDSLATDKHLKTRYLDQDRSYYNSVKCVLKSDADVFLDITEKFFNMNSFSRFSPLATDYILRSHKTRFTNKVELYTAYILHIPTLAARLNVEECQQVVLKLARASYLNQWFNYKVVQPLINRLRPDKRAAFKKQVFIEKDVGDCEDKWPYETPTPPTESDTGPHIFDEPSMLPFCKSVEHHIFGLPNLPSHAILQVPSDFQLRCLKADLSKLRLRIKTDLDRLCEEFLFVGFDRTLHKLGQRLGVTKSADRRCDIFLVLASKTGGRTEAVSALLNLAARHSNEPPHTRASILRSLVKRANVWRLPADDWKNLVDFGHGLGLDGAPSEAACIEGLHAVVIRQLLAGECEQAVRVAFFKDFSTLAEYSLRKDERPLVVYALRSMLEAAANDEEPAVAAERLSQLLDVLKVYGVKVEPTSTAVKAVVALALRDADIARPLLQQLYDTRIARRELLHLNMEFRRDGAALVNALRHDPSALTVKRVADTLAVRKKSFDKFTSKLVVYFSQKQDFIVKLRSALKQKIAEQQNEENTSVSIARPLASLLYQNFEKELYELDVAGKKSAKFAAALRACAHRAWPIVNLAEWGWRIAGVKAVATRAMRCRERDRAALTRALAAERRTVRVALALSMRSAGGPVLETFASAAKLRPIVVLKTALPYFRRYSAAAEPGVWNIVKPLISSVDLKPRDRLRRLLENTDWIPSTIKPDYCATLYLAIKKISCCSADKVFLSKLLRRDLSKLLPEADDTVEHILLQALENTEKNILAIPYPSICVRYLLLSRNEEDVEERFQKIGNRFLDQLDTLRCEKEDTLNRRLFEVIESLLYNSAFFNTKYSSCYSVIERILTRMQTFLPEEENFMIYAHMHLTMLYFKAVRHSMTQMPDVFADSKRRKSEGVKAVGLVFGTYIVQEAAELVNTYFDSIIELYTEVVVSYLRHTFSYGRSKGKLVGYVLKGIMAEGVGIQRRMAVQILGDRPHKIDSKTRKELEEQMFQDKDIEMFVYAQLFMKSDQGLNG